MARTGIGIGQALSEWSRDQGGTAATETALDVLRVAEELLASAASDDTDPALWHEYLDVTGAPDFLERLPDRETRDRWAESAFGAINYRLQVFDIRIPPLRNVAPTSFRWPTPSCGSSASPSVGHPPG